jgi:peptidoglycan/xylan/chitin deacetylase (PgdA/CDA1 family)
MTPGWPRILNYHGIVKLEVDPNKTGVSPARFESHMLALKRRNLWGVSIRELLQAWKEGESKGMVGLTFDDGYDDFLHTALPILEKFTFSATLFVVAGMLGRENDWEHYYDPRPRRRLLEAADLREVAERGVEIGSHSMRHTRLTKLNPESMESEVAGSRRLLGEVLGEAVEGFAYPYGTLGDAAVQAVRRAGYSYACGVNTRLDKSAYDLPRIPIMEADGNVRFAAKLSIHSHYRMVKRSYLRILGDRSCQHRTPGKSAAQGSTELAMISM